MFYSNDGETFKDCNINFETNAGAFDKIAYTGDKFFGISYKKIGISSDGITWTTQSDDINWMYGGYYNGKYVAVGTDIHNNSRKVLAISNVNSGWDVTECITNFPTKRMSSISSFAMESGGNYILSENSTGISLDLLNWKSNLGYEFDSYRSILFDGKRFVAVTNDSVISSINGIAWETNYKLLDRIDQTDDIYKYFNDIYFSNGKYYIYGVKWGDGWENYVWISDDLTNWKDYKLRINDYVENRNSNLSGIQVSIIENRAVLVGNSFEAKQMIIATSDDMYNFTPIKTDSYKSSIGKVYYYDNKYFTFTTEALDEKVLSANPFYTITKASAFKDYIYISNDLKTFKKLELPSNHVKAIYPFKDSFVVVAREYPKFKVYLTKDFIKYESYEIPTEIPNLNLTGDEEGIYNVFSIDDVLYITGARVMYTKNFKDWTILNSLPSNGYISVATNDNYAVIGGHGIMVKIFQGNLIVTPNGK